MKAAIYARVSTLDQEPENQLAEHRRYVRARSWPAAEEYVDKGVSGSTDRRPALDRLVRDATRRGFDVLVVWRLDRLGRNLRHLVALLDELQPVGVSFVSLGEGIDCTTPAGTLMLHVLATLAEFERARCVERVQAGLARAKRQGKTLGRPQRIIAPFALAKVAEIPRGRAPRPWASPDPRFSGAWPKNPSDVGEFWRIFLSKTGCSDPQSRWPVIIRLCASAVTGSREARVTRAAGWADSDNPPEAAPLSPPFYCLP